MIFNNITELKWLMNKQLGGVDVIYMSRSLGLGIVAAFFYLKNMLFKFCITVICLFCMYILGEVGPFLGVILAIFTFYFRKESFYLILSIVTGILFYFFIIQEFVPDLTIESVSNDPRVEIYIRNFNYFSDHPFYGIGIAGSVSIISHYQSAHNVFLEIAAELGIMGLIPFVGMVILLLKKFLKSKDFLFSYLWLYSFIVIQFSGDIGLNPLFWFFSAIFMSAPIKKDIAPTTQFGI
jgi:O-antigen ligase